MADDLNIGKHITEHAILNVFANSKNKGLYLLLDASNDPITGNLRILGTSTPTLILESSDASDPTFTFKTTNTAHQIDIGLDEDQTTDTLNIRGKTASVDITARP